MCASVSAAQVRILVAAIVLVTIYQSGVLSVLSIGDGMAAGRAASVDPPGGAPVPTDQPPAPPHNSAPPERHGRQLARRYDPPAREPSAAETAKAGQPLLP